MTDHGPCLSRSGLRRRGWTETAIGRFLVEPDFESDNPHFPGGAPAKMYTMARIEAAEQTTEFVLWKEKRSKRIGKDVPRQLSQTEDAQAKEPTKAGNDAEASRDSRRDGNEPVAEALGHALASRVWRQTRAPLHGQSECETSASQQARPQSGERDKPGETGADDVETLSDWLEGLR